jgi:rare lipoprotein A (RlpA)-like double-psi beta-barrel protein
VRRLRVVAGLALTALLAMAAFPGSVGSQGLSPAAPIDASLFRAVDAASTDGIAATTLTLDPAYRSDGALTEASILVDPDRPSASSARPNTAAILPDAPVRAVAIPQWHFDGDISWYGPGFYGRRTACGQAMTRDLVGVAHRSLPCGTRVTFRNPGNGRVVTARVVDRGPYVDGRTWDMTAGLCLALGHCYTGTIYWKLS